MTSVFVAGVMFALVPSLKGSKISPLGVFEPLWPRSRTTVGVI